MGDSFEFQISWSRFFSPIHMKLKQQPDDFQVEELTDLVPGGTGAFALYRLEKSGWSTPDAIASIRRRWQVALNRVSYGGLKDRHARTVQYLTIHNGPRRGLKHHTVKLDYLGQTAAPFTAQDIRANRFRIVIRDVPQAVSLSYTEALEAAGRDGVPNFFDDQRFGSVAKGGEFSARLLILGRYEDALKLALTASYEFDRAVQRQEKAVLQAHWGDWTTCKEQLPRGHARILIAYLRTHPTDFRGALARLRPELRGLYLSAYQSYLWNRMLARWLSKHCRPEQLIPISLRLGEVPMHHDLDPAQQHDLATLTLPLPSARTKLDPSDPRLALVEEVLNEEGLQLQQMRIKGIREMFFSRGERPALCMPENLKHETVPDDRHSGKQKLLLAFDLPRGSYATLIVKRITSR